MGRGKTTGLLMNVVSRKNGFEADAFAATTYNAHALAEALKKLSVDN
jgi:STE24 endopeptidase